MKALQFKKYLISKRACDSALQWQDGKSLDEVWETCNRGDWMLWLIQKANLCDIRKLTLIKVECVELISHLIKNEKSKNALIVAKKFGERKATKKELDAAASVAAVVAANAAVYALNYTDYSANNAAFYAITYADYAANTATAVADAYAATKTTKTTNDYDVAYANTRQDLLKKCADICRKHLPTVEITNDISN